MTNKLFLQFINARGLGGAAQAIYYDIKSPAGGIYISRGAFQIHSGVEELPVVEVTWIGAQAYCEWVGGRLPSATEWHKAAIWNPSTGGTTVYPWGSDFDDTAANIQGSQLRAIGSFPTGVSPVGAYDMLGNVSEWVSNGRGVTRFHVGSAYTDTWRTVNILELQQATESFHTQTIGFRCVFDD